MKSFKTFILETNNTLARKLGRAKAREVRGEAEKHNPSRYVLNNKMHGIKSMKGKNVARVRYHNGNDGNKHPSDPMQHVGSTSKGTHVFKHKESFSDHAVHHYAVVHRNGKSSEHYLHPIGTNKGPNHYSQKFTPKKITHKDLDHGTQHKHSHANEFNHGKQSHNLHGQDREVKHIVAKDHNKYANKEYF
jgi:hypothetical protein